MLLELSAFSQIPRADGVVETACPQLSAIMGDVNAARTIRVTLELPIITVTVES